MSSFHIFSIFALFIIIIVPAGALAYKFLFDKKDLIEVECEILTLESNGEMSSSWRGKLRYYIDGKEYINNNFVFYRLKLRDVRAGQKVKLLCEKENPMKLYEIKG